ncbi:MAG TPA: DeoR/GlpR family DNA-binding transcription regulator [Phycisphaerae bacterium]|nr:DeoR/GlpR transcriptional regulator [Phycisphaerae bacterium]HOB73921.1 DeoR/GlpR family DNA-binding transcription regulator [Phycisphaerae bacterium]HOJ56281.1 DeoR/GlpR family DNA-binding transcription regulator [Phycisphaerae bacterium]HOL28127.1 DeoR/GlpR family DNA-binding transcription regulator [Phycisphaerae bacterium]HPP19762.1 DeoR/GlpR family DNA-binding transcription regulator [Phycisphaerae bacterium]
MTGEARRQQLSEFLARRGYADLAVLVSELGVSESTIRRDLSQMEEEGIVRRTHGGAVFISDRFSALNYDAREATAVAEKQAIGQAAAGLIQEGETILLDGGTTTFQVARQLLNRSLQVVTNSLPIAHLLNSAPHIELIFVGGFIYPRTGVALGPLAVQALGSLHVSKAFMGVAGIAEDGLYNANVLMVETELQMMRCAEEVIVVADQSKFGRRGLARLSGWEAVHRVIADEGLEARWHQVVRDAGAELILAEVKKGNGGTASVEAGAWRRAELRSDLRR